MMIIAGKKCCQTSTTIFSVILHFPIHLKVWKYVHINHYFIVLIVYSHLIYTLGTIKEIINNCTSKAITLCNAAVFHSVVAFSKGGEVIKGEPHFALKGNSATLQPHSPCLQHNNSVYLCENCTFLWSVVKRRRTVLKNAYLWHYRVGLEVGKIDTEKLLFYKLFFYKWVSIQMEGISFFPTSLQLS